MGRPRGPKPKRTQLEVVREGNPGKARHPSGLRLRPGRPDEPDWREWFPSDKDADKQARAAAAATWKRIVDELDDAGVISKLDGDTVAEYCIVKVRIRQCEREISEHGIWVAGERGKQKNPAVTAVNQYRSALKIYIAELGLSPASRPRLPGEGDRGDETPWDV